MTVEVPAGLRERRRRETTAEIRRAAMDLFESVGWEATTVAAIAARAGVSTRTFFRYFDSKEQAILPGHRRLADAVSGLELAQRSMRGAADAVRALLRDAALGEGGVEEIDEHRRIARLFRANPHLHAMAAAQEAAYVQDLHERLIALLPEESPVHLRALTEMAMATWRTAWWSWGEELSADPGASPLDSFRAADAAMRAVSGVTTGE